MLGDNYATLEFKRTAADAVPIATQYVAKNVETYVDRVVIKGIPEAAQNWIAPSVSDPTAKVIWNMFNNRCHIKIDDYALITMGSHEHTLCGNKEVDAVAHVDGSIHDSLVSFVEVKSVDEMLSMAAIKYFALSDDIEVTKALDALPDGSAICLNGNTLKVAKGLQLFNISDKKIYITDCVKDGKATLTHSNTQNSSIAPMFNVSGTAELYLYNVKVDGLVTSSTNNQKFVNAAGGKVVMSSTSIVNVTNESTDGFITVNNAGLVLDNVKIENINNSKKFMTIDTAVTNVNISSVSIINNNNSGYILSAEGSNEVKLGKINIEKNISTGAGSIINVNGGTVTFTSDKTVVKNNKGVNGSVIQMASGKIKAEANIEMSDNEATNGAVIYMKGGEIVTDTDAESLTFKNNKAVNGGAIYVDTATFKPNAKMTMVDNEANNGSAIFAKDSTIDMSASNYDITIKDNIATAGTIYFDNVKGYVTGTHGFTFDGNKAKNGAVYAFINNNTAVTISGIELDGINVDNSNAIYFKDGSEVVTIKDSKFANIGSATSVGSVMYIDNAKVTLDKQIVFNNNYNAIFNNGGTFTTTTLTGEHATTIDDTTTNDIVFVNGLGNYVLSGNNNATFNLGGGVFKNTANDSTYAYKLSTPSGISANGKVNFIFNGNIAFITGSNMRNIYVTNAATESFKIGTATTDMKLAYYVPSRGTKVIDDIKSASGFTDTFTYKDVIIVESPNRDPESPTEPWAAYTQSVNNVENVYIGYKTYEVTVHANGGMFKGLTGDSHIIVPEGKVNPTTYSILIPNGYKINYLATPSRVGYKKIQFSTKASASEPGAIVVTNDTTYNYETHGTNIYVNWNPITYTIKFDPATTSVTETMPDIPNVRFDQEIELPPVAYRVEAATFSNWIDKSAIDYTKEDPEKAERITKKYLNKAKVKNLRCTDGDVVTLYANWETGPFDVIFNQNTPVSPGGYVNDVTGTMNNQTMPGSGERALNKNYYGLTGYRFIGWSLKPLTATEAEAIESDKTKYYVDQQVVELDPEGKKELNLYAMWGRSKMKVTLAQNETSGNVGDPYVGQFDILYDQRFSDLPAFAPKTRENYVFTGKFITTKIPGPYARKTYNGTNDYTADSVNRNTANFTLYPLWINNEVMITMELGEGSLPSGYTNNQFVGYLDAPYFSVGTTSEPKNADGSLVKPLPATVTRIFKKWSTNAAGTDEINASTIYTDSSNNKVYAIFADIYDITISYSRNGGSGTMAPTVVKAGVKVRLRDNIFTRSGYSFNGWRGSDGKYYSNGQEVTLYENVTLSAQWSKNGGGGDGPSGSGGGSGSGGTGGKLPTSEPTVVDVAWSYDPTTDTYIAVDLSGNPVSGWQYTRDVNDNKNSWHYFDSNGTAKTGWINDGTGIYFLDNTGSMITGLANIDGIAREFRTDGKLIGDDYGIDAEVVAAGGNGSGDNGNWNYNPLNNTWQYMVNGEPAKNMFFESDVTGVSCWYAVDANGNMLTGLVKTNGNIYYLQEVGVEAGKLMANVVINIGGVLFETDAAGKIIGDTSLISNIANVYDMDQSIAQSENATEVQQAVTNFVNTQVAEGFVNGGNGEVYFMVPVTDAAGKVSYQRATGVVQIDGLYYFFGDDGIMRTGLTQINGQTYYLTEEGYNVGSVYVGYITVGGATYFCDPANGGAATRVS